MDRTRREAPAALIVILNGHSARAFVLLDSTRTASWSATTAPPPVRGAAIGLPHTILLTALAECKSTISNHHGAIQVDSKPGHGSVFSLLLPLADRRRATSADTTAVAPSVGRRHVLVADDQPSVLQVTAWLLAELGYRVTTERDGATALNFCREAWRDIDLVFLNVMVPAMSGPAVLLETRRINPTVPAVLCSGHPLGPGDEDLVGEEGVRFVEKSLTLQNLARCVAAVLPLP